MGILAPQRRRGVDLHRSDVDPTLVERRLRDVAQANAWFGGTRAVLACLGPVFRTRRRWMTLLDVGIGAGDIPERARVFAARRDVALETLGLEHTVAIASRAAWPAGQVCVGDALALPFKDQSIDIVICSEVLHHFDDADAVVLLRELDRVARSLVIVADLRRSWFAVIGVWLASFPLGFHPASRHAGVRSVLRGYRRGELAALVTRATGVVPHAVDRLGFRVTASWSAARVRS
ncbi:MAG: methyltransferase domain-containing protein [Gemmatimonadaceae bacterium]|nr:methyltransferase domain-containing protein [Gemmatimonadaceae bacterium]